MAQLLSAVYWRHESFNQPDQDSGVMSSAELSMYQLDFST